MAKMIDKIRQMMLVQRISATEAAIKFLKDYLPIILEGKQRRMEEQLRILALKNAERLVLPARKAGLETLYGTEVLTEKIKKTEDRFYWRVRACDQSFRRAIARMEGKEGENKKTLLGNDHEKSLAGIEERKNACLAALRNPAAPSFDLPSAKATYESLKKAADDRLEALRQQQTASYALFAAGHQKKIGSKIGTKERHLAEMKAELSKVTVVDPHLEGQIGLEDILRLDHLSMHFGGLKAVDDLSFSVKKGEVFGLIGPNGAGKTTVFNCITRFYKPTAGTVYFRDRLNVVHNLNNFKVHNVIRKGIVRTFQNIELIWELNVLDNLLVAGHTLFQTGFFGQLLNVRRLRQEESVMRKKAENILVDLGLMAYMYMPVLGLPYGILKRVEFARTLMVDPQLIILDEPAAGLNDQETEHLVATIRKVQKDYDTTIFLVEHDMGLVMNVCDTVCAISFGKMLAIGTPKEIQSSKIVREAYLGGE